MTVSAVALEQRRIADLEAQGIYVRRVEWVCEHALRRPVDTSKQHWHKPMPQMVRPNKAMWGVSENWRGQVA